MADEVLFIPGFGLSPRCAEGVPAIKAAVDGFRQHFDVTVFHWPSVVGGPDAPPTWRGAADTIAAALPRGGHVVAISGNITYALVALGDGANDVRSLVCDGFDVPPTTWLELGMSTLASAEEAVMGIINSERGRHGALSRFPGAEAEVARTITDQMYSDADWPYEREFVRDANTLNLLDLELSIRLPALYLEVESGFSGAVERRDLFRRLVPTAEFDEAEPWRYHDPSSGKAFANRAIPFLQEHSARTVLSTVLFADIVDSTVHAATMGDRRWSQLLDQFHSLAGSELRRSGGRLVDTAGDGFLAVFDDPGKAIACAAAVAGQVEGVGLEVRAGVHTGQVEVSGEKYSGVAVHTAARVAAKAGPGEVLVSETVRQLLAGSDLSFEDRGGHQLKGLPAALHLYAAQASRS